MMKFGMFNSINGDRKYKAENFAQYFATFIGNGIFVKPSDCLQILAVSNSTNVIVRPGKAWINGFYLINDEDYTLSISGGDRILNRIDRVVVRLDFIQRKMSVEVKQGTLSASPVAPTLKRDADAYELALADIYVAKGALTITQASITDTRLNNNLCGLMHGVVDQVDTTTIFNQYQGWYIDVTAQNELEIEQWKTATIASVDQWISEQEDDFVVWSDTSKQGFQNWFDNIKSQLETIDITAHITAKLPHEFVDSVSGVTYMYGFSVSDGKLEFNYEEVV